MSCAHTVIARLAHADGQPVMQSWFGNVIRGLMAARAANETMSR